MSRWKGERTAMKKQESARTLAVLGVFPPGVTVAETERWLACGREADRRVAWVSEQSDPVDERLREAGVILVRRPDAASFGRSFGDRSVLDEAADVDLVFELWPNETVAPGWREKIERDWNPRDPALVLPVVFRGRETNPFPRWVAFETRVRTPRFPTKGSGRVKSIEIQREPWAGEATIALIRGLESALREVPGDPKIRLELLESLFETGDFSHALEIGKAGDLHRRKWTEIERSVYDLVVSEFMRESAAPRSDAINRLLSAAAECPSYREPWARLCFELALVGNWLGAWASGANALAITENPPGTSRIDPSLWTGAVEDLVRLARNRLGVPESKT